MKLSLMFILLILFSCYLFSQDQKQDPFSSNYTLGHSEEIALYWNVDNFSEIDNTVNYKLFDYYSNFGQFFIDSSNGGNYSSSDFLLGEKKGMDVITGDFDGDGLDEIISAWEGSGNSLNLVVPNIDKETLNFNDEYMFKLPGVLYSNPKTNSVRFRIIKGNFDNDTFDEFAIVLWNVSGNLEIQIYNVDMNSHQPVMVASISDENMSSGNNNAGLYDIAPGDFDGDLVDEIVMVAYEESNADWFIYTKIYDVTENNGIISLVPKARKEDFYNYNDWDDPSHRINNLAIASGNFNGNFGDEFVIDFILYKSDSETYNYLLPGSVSMDLDTIFVNKENIFSTFNSLSETSLSISIQAADMNNDGRDEIISDGDGRIDIIEADNELHLTKKAGNSFSSFTFNNRRMVVADLNASTDDSTWLPEIIVAASRRYEPDDPDDWYTTLEIIVFEPILDASGNIISLMKRIAYTVDSVPQSPMFYYSLAAGDFDGGSIRLGKPNYYSATDIVQPLVILNAPPTHFDMFGNEIFDINGSYNGQESNFVANYYTESETNIEVETELHSAWTVGGSVSGGFEVPIIKTGVELKLEAEYGKDFSKTNTQSNSYRVSQNISSSNDDFIYAITVDYDIWEYPIIANDTIQGYTMVVSPGEPQRSWFPSKSPQATNYIPDHEVGNILSYNQIAAPSDNNSLESVLKWNTSDQITLDGSPGFEYNWALENETQTEQTETNEVHSKIGASASFESTFPFVPNFEFNGEYSNETVSTSKNTVTYKKGLEVHLGPIDLSIGETYYSVTPYAYWAKSGALVLDYGVNPRSAPPGVPQTWFQEQYGNKPDPALTLPWRLDPEKGISITDDKRQQTKEIIFNPDNPKIGEIVTIQTRVHNYSFLNTSGPVAAQFYLGDPNNGGILLESRDEKTEFATDDFIPARESKIISFDWTVPNGVALFYRIYVVLDPNNEIDEIHESNNIGWKILPLYDLSTDVKKETQKPSSYELSQNYPNPFNPSTIIRYTIPENGFVKIKIFDILGREVSTLINKEQNSGNYEVEFDASNLTSGVYFYRIQAGDFVQTKKMVLMK